MSYKAFVDLVADSKQEIKQALSLRVLDVLIESSKAPAVRLTLQRVYNLVALSSCDKGKWSETAELALQAAGDEPFNEIDLTVERAEKLRDYTAYMTAAYFAESFANPDKYAEAIAEAGWSFYYGKFADCSENAYKACKAASRARQRYFDDLGWRFFWLKFPLFGH